MPNYPELATTLLLALVAAAITYIAASKLPPSRSDGSRASSRGLALFDFLFYTVVPALLILYAVLDIRKYEAYGLWGVDFSLFDQAIWNSLHGRLFQDTVVLDSPVIIGQHFSVILLALVPLYAVFPDPRTLAIAPVLAVGLTVFPLYWFARREIGPALGFVVSLAYLLSPGLQLIALDQFYEIMLAMPLLLLAAIFLWRRRYVPFLALVVLLFICKEDMPLIAVGFGLFLILFRRQWKLGGGLALFSLAWFVVLIQWIIPYFQGGSSFFYFNTAHSSGGQYSYLGTSLSEIIRNLLTHPTLAVQHMTIPPKIDTILKILLPLSLLPFIGAEMSALALPTLAYTLLSDRDSQFMLGSHHYSAVFPFLLLGTVIGLHRLLRWADARLPAKRQMAFRAALGVLLLAATLSNYYLYAPGPLARGFDPNRFAPTAHDAVVETIASKIPPDASVLVQAELSPRVSERKHIYIMTAIPCLGAADYLFADMTQPWFGYNRSVWEEDLALPFFHTVAEQDGVILKARSPLQPPDHVLNVSFENGISLWGYTLPLTGTVTGGRGINVFTAWRTDRSVQTSYNIQAQLLDAEGHLWAEDNSKPCRGYSPTDHWQPGEVVNDDQTFYLPPTIPGGDYSIVYSLYDKATDKYLLPLGAVQTDIPLTSLHIEKNKNSFLASELIIENPLYVDMHEMRLLGFKPLPQVISRGDTLHVGIYWRARGKPQGDYEAFVQLRDGRGQTTAEQVSRPAENTYPTTLWNTGEVLLDWHDLPLPHDLAPGDYQIFVGLRDAATNQVLGEANISSVTIEP
ncbi:MAG: DUF2079 domain-containing protein [Chloroflexi bacterium]|nr:DUF2079 domain-containing protein [Chloroflexota bacterium]